MRLLRKELVSGLIVSAVFVYLFDPIMRFMFRLLVGITSPFGSWYLDRIFSEMATGPTNYAYVLYVFFVGAFTTWMTAMTVAATLRRWGPDQDGEFEPTPRSPWSLYVTNGLLLLFALLAVTDGHARLRMSTTFDQHLTILAPVVPAQDLLELKARFASMAGRADYLAVRARVDALAKERGITLPDNRLYMWF